MGIRFAVVVAVPVVALAAAFAEGCAGTDSRTGWSNGGSSDAGGSGSGGGGSGSSSGGGGSSSGGSGSGGSSSGSGGNGGTSGSGGGRPAGAAKDPCPAGQVLNAASECVDSYSGRPLCGSGYMVPDANGKCVPLPACAPGSPNTGMPIPMCVCPAGLEADGTGICVAQCPGSGQGGSGLSTLQTNTCTDASAFSPPSYHDAPSLCDYVIQRFAYYQCSECGHCNPPLMLNVDVSLNSAAQAEAESVADGSSPMGSDVEDHFYATLDGTGNPTNSSTFTACDSDAIPTWNPVGSMSRDCAFFSGNSEVRIVFYHGCMQDPQPTRVGCGVAADTRGLSWRVVKIGP